MKTHTVLMHNPFLRKTIAKTMIKKLMGVENLTQVIKDNNGLTFYSKRNRRFF